MITRREFLKICMSSALTISLTKMLDPIIKQAYAESKLPKPPVIWLELGSCTGESISFDNAFNPDLHQIITEMLDIRFNWLLNAAQGDLAVKTLLDTVEKEAGNFWLIVEGSVQTADNGRYDHIFLRNGEMVTGLAAIKEFSAKAKYIVAVGDCACFGGPSAAHPNPGGAKGVWDVVDKKVINVPGCPSHYDWMVGTFSHLLLYGLPELDAYNRPKMFFGKTIHELCQRRQQFEDGIFASFPGDDGCLFKVGCKGPVTHADCPLRQWNHYVNWPVKAGTPCIGCASPHFPDGSMPFYNHLPDIQTPSVAVNTKKLGLALSAIGVGAVGTHLAAGIFAKRIHKHYVKGTKPTDPEPPETLEQLNQELDDIIKKQTTLITKARQLEQRNCRKQKRRKPLLHRLADFWRTEDNDGRK